MKMLLQLLLFAFPIAITNCHVAKNSSDIIMVGGHADLQHEHTFFLTTRSSRKSTTPSSDSEDEYIKNDTPKKGMKKNDEDEGVNNKDGVVFVPTDKYIFKNENENVHEDTLKVADLYEGKELTEKTEKPGEVLFIQGKNRDKENEPKDLRKYNREDKTGEFKYIDDEEDATTTTPIPLDCDHLDCDNNHIESICGRKVERSIEKHRLFKNECFFRKVNCEFQTISNRYHQVAAEFCKTVGMHVTNQPYEVPIYLPPPVGRHRQKGKNLGQKNKKRVHGIVFGGRRAMAMNVGGSYCGHTCPNFCTKDYEPECAISATGARRVFLNHCDLDMNSCQYDIFWRRRPLAECTGGKKADLHQNRAFVDWMQRTGIVDKKGRLVLN